MDILVIDIFMPEKDSIEVLREIRNLPQMPAIVTISGANINADFYTRVTRFLGASGTLLKPFTLDQMLGVLSNLKKDPVLNNAEYA
jgi:CheY-like chemotaxis protein